MKIWKFKKQLKKEALGGKVEGNLALTNALSNKSSKWPSRIRENRIEPFCEPVISPEHVIRKDNEIFAIGSCFARNIEVALKKNNFNVPSANVRFPQEELWSGTHSHAGLLNKYTPQAILNELNYVFKDSYKAEDFLIEGNNGKYMDMQLHTNQGVNFKRGVERREQIKEMIKKFVTSADVVVITLGLVEVWWDNLNKLFLNEMPSKDLLDKHKGRFYFQTMSPEQVFETLSEVITILKCHMKPSAWILLTVSPVPLGRTFRDKDVIVANMYSKSLLRVAAELECEKSEFVEYFASYESVMLSSRESTWLDDLIHVDSSAVERITSRMIDSYCQ